MRIFIRAVQFQGGSLQVINSLLKDLIHFEENEYIVLISDPVKKQLKGVDFPNNFLFIDAPNRSGNFIKLLLKRLLISSKIESEYKPDCVLTTSGPSYWRSKAPHVIGYNLPHHIYQESPYFANLSFRSRLRWGVKRVAHRYFFRRDADAIFVQTEDVNQRLRKFIGRDNVYTISNTYNQVFKNWAPSTRKLKERTVDEIRLLTVCAFYPHKNLEIITSVVKELRKRGYDNVKFILTLKKEIFEEKFGAIDSNIINVGPQPIIECPSLYSEIDFMFLPTLLECFSASYAEAMVMSKPILTSDLGFARTVCGEAAVYFDPINPLDISKKIIELIQNPVLQKQLIESGKSRMNLFSTSIDRTKRILELCKIESLKNKID